MPLSEEERKIALFRNHTWAVELKLAMEGNSQRLTGNSSTCPIGYNSWASAT